MRFRGGSSRRRHKSRRGKVFGGFHVRSADLGESLHGLVPRSQVGGCDGEDPIDFVAAQDTKSTPGHGVANSGNEIGGKFHMHLYRCDRLRWSPERSLRVGIGEKCGAAFTRRKVVLQSTGPAWPLRIGCAEVKHGG